MLASLVFTQMLVTSLPDENGDRVSTVLPVVQHFSDTVVPAAWVVNDAKMEGLANPPADDPQKRPGHGQCRDESIDNTLNPVVTATSVWTVPADDEATKRTVYVVFQSGTSRCRVAEQFPLAATAVPTIEIEQVVESPYPSTFGLIARSRPSPRMATDCGPTNVGALGGGAVVAGAVVGGAVVAGTVVTGAVVGGAVVAGAVAAGAVVGGAVVAGAFVGGLVAGAVVAAAVVAGLVGVGSLVGGSVAGSVGAVEASSVRGSVGWVAAELGVLAVVEGATVAGPGRVPDAGGFVVADVGIGGFVDGAATGAVVAGARVDDVVGEAAGMAATAALGSAIGASIPVPRTSLKAGPLDARPGSTAATLTARSGRGATTASCSAGTKVLAATVVASARAAGAWATGAARLPSWRSSPMAWRGQPGGEPGDAPQAAQANVQEGAHHVRVEVRAGAAHDLGLGGGHGHRPLVRAHGGHRLEGVGEGDDAPGERDVRAGELVRVARAVPLLVVLADAVPPWSEPVLQRVGEAGAGRRVTGEDRPLLRVGATLEVEDLGGHGDLAEVVEQRRPPELLQLLLVEADLGPDQLGVGADAFGVAAGQTVVAAQGGDHRHDLRRYVLRLDREAALVDVAQPLFEIAGTRGTQRRAQALRRLVREGEGEAQQEGQRGETLHRHAGGDHRSGRDGEDGEQAGDADHDVRRAGQHIAEQQRHAERDEGRRDDDRALEEEGQPATRAPDRGIVVAARTVRRRSRCGRDDDGDGLARRFSGGGPCGGGRCGG